MYEFDFYPAHAAGIKLVSFISNRLTADRQGICRFARLSHTYQTSRNPGRFDPIPVLSDSFGRFGPTGAGRFSPVSRWVVLAQLKG